MHKCNRCKKQFKFLSYLLRHENNKIQCEEILETKDKPKDVIDINNMLYKILDELDNPSLATNIKNMINSIIEFNNNNEPKIDEDIEEDIDEDIDDNNSNKNKCNKCNKCNKKFSSRQGLSRHKLKQRCKELAINTNSVKPQQSNLTFDNIINSNLSVADNIDSIDNSVVNNNTTNNNITNNNEYTINLNPFRCETLEHITLEDFKIIYKSVNNIDNKLSYFIYKRNPDNIYFYKNNVNKNIVSFMNDKMEIQTMTHDQFIKELKTNINDSKIELFCIFKNNLSRDEIYKYMKNMIVYHTNLINNDIAKKDINNSLIALLDIAYRDKDKKDTINKIVKKLCKDKDIKKKYQRKHKDRIKLKMLRTKEYDIKPPIDNTDPKNLYNIKTEINNALSQSIRNNLDI